ncbi:MAG: hypothetical protein ACYC6L_00515 [Anaerolineae bacterium]
MLTQLLISYLLSSPDPVLRGRTRRELLGLPDDDPLVAADRAALPGSPAVRALLSAMTPARPWPAGERGQPNRWVTLYALLAKKYAGRLAVPPAESDV